MAATKTILQKLQDARDIIKKSDLKKVGTNTYSKYDYYTPEQVEALVEKACKETETICLCNLKADEFGLYQELIFIDLKDEENSILFQLRTKHGSLKATNETQQMGGTDTYSERYIKMKVFQIKDNNLDFDSQDNTEKPKTTPKYDNSKKIGTCSVCGKQVIDGKFGVFCPDYKQHKADGIKWEVVTKKSDYHKKLEKQLDLPSEDEQAKNQVEYDLKK